MNIKFIRFQIEVFWVVTPCIIIGVHQGFGRTFFPLSSGSMWMLKQSGYLYTYCKEVCHLDQEQGRTWRRTEHVPSKCWYPLSILRVVANQNSTMWTLAAVKTSNLYSYASFHLKNTYLIWELHRGPQECSLNILSTWKYIFILHVALGLCFKNSFNDIIYSLFKIIITFSYKGDKLNAFALRTEIQ
jgi:hypothetical protein